MKTGRLAATALVLLSASSIFWQCTGVGAGGTRVSYWLWAGVTAHDVPPNSELYIYQGLISTDGENSVYERRGLFPHPIECEKLYLVYRLEGNLPSVQDVLKEFEHAVVRWQRHPVVVSGIQLDFDSPTAKLDAYSRFLHDFRQRLPQQFELSITGLGDWVMSGDREVLASISSAVDELVIQLYQGRQPLKDIDEYLLELSCYPLPFRIGLLSGFDPSELVETLRSNPHFGGTIYFVVRTP